MTRSIRLERGFGTLLWRLEESGESFAMVGLGRTEEFSVGELVVAETASRERFLLRVEECRSYRVEEIPEDVALEAGFANGFSLQFVMRNLKITEVTVTRFGVIKYIEYDF